VLFARRSSHGGALLILSARDSMTAGWLAINTARVGCVSRRRRHRGRHRECTSWRDAECAKREEVIHPLARRLHQGRERDSSAKGWGKHRAGVDALGARGGTEVKVTLPFVASSATHRPRRKPSRRPIISLRADEDDVFFALSARWVVLYLLM
jgi:hypothetical protein